MAGIHEPRKSLDPGFEHAGVTDETECFTQHDIISIYFLFFCALPALRGKIILRVPSGFFFV
jgi:hypothetical protein